MASVLSLSSRLRQRRCKPEGTREGTCYGDAVSFAAKTTVLLIASLTLVHSSATASDFWDEVREPGISQYRRLTDEAELALRARRLTDALRLSDEAIALIDDAPRGHMIRGLAAGERGAVDDGAQSITRALALDPTSLDGAFAERATAVLLRANALIPARSILERAVRSAGPGIQRDTLFATYGDVLQALGPDHLEAAIGAYREALRERGNSGRAQLGLALALRRQGAAISAWRSSAQAAADSTARQLLLSLSLPPAEIESRAALLMEVAEDLMGARTAWERAATGPWAIFAQEAAMALQ